MKIKKLLCTIVCAAIVFSLAGCGNKSDALTANTAGTLKLKAGSGLGTVDVDLTVLSSTVVYSEVFNMTNTPDSYKGKVVKMNGQCGIYRDEATGSNYYACLIQDTSACCSQGIEFTLTKDYASPADYPNEGDNITVVGVFDTYTENGVEYGTLKNASLVV